MLIYVSVIYTLYRIVLNMKSENRKEIETSKMQKHLSSPSIKLRACSAFDLQLSLCTASISFSSVDQRISLWCNTTYLLTSKHVIALYSRTTFNHLLGIHEYATVVLGTKKKQKSYKWLRLWRIELDSSIVEICRQFAYTPPVAAYTRVTSAPIRSVQRV